MGVNISRVLHIITAMLTARLVASGGVMARWTTAPRCRVGIGRAAIQRGKTGAGRPAIILERRDQEQKSAYQGNSWCGSDRAERLLVQIADQPIQGEVTGRCLVV